jgi:aqualysin 1
VVPWGIDRVDADISSTLAGNGKEDFGTNRDSTLWDVRKVNAYIIDTGVDASHADLNVDIVNQVNFRGDGKNYDCNGHGTHVAGTVAAKDKYEPGRRSHPGGG